MLRGSAGCKSAIVQSTGAQKVAEGGEGAGERRRSGMGCLMVARQALMAHWVAYQQLSVVAHHELDARVT